MKQRKKTGNKNEQGIGELWDNFKQSNRQVLGVPEGKRTWT